MSDENATNNETLTESPETKGVVADKAEHAGRAEQATEEQPTEAVEEQAEPAPVVDQAAAAEDEPPPAEQAEAAEEEPDAVEDAGDEGASEQGAEPDLAAESLPAAPIAPAEPASKKQWYVVKVQSGREETIKAAIERKVKIEGLEEFFGQIAVPVERVTEVKKVKVTDKKTGEKVTQEKRVVRSKKKYQGYIFAEVEFNENILYLFRETSGVGDFVGATMHRAPSPMTDREVQQMLTGVHEKDPKGGKGPKMPVKVKLDFEKGDKVRIRDGAFTNMEGEVKLITEPKDATENHKVTVVVTVFGRPVDVVLDHWHVDKV
ncbi:MAG TPA: transcription termination/antitermination protein NusG [Gemmataceae bacterium]|nr:transcription termination/antitermination protein NusG [Gemmataceae bacterium]